MTLFFVIRLFVIWLKSLKAGSPAPPTDVEAQSAEAAPAGELAPATAADEAAAEAPIEKTNEVSFENNNPTISQVVEDKQEDQPAEVAAASEEPAAVKQE